MMMFREIRLVQQEFREKSRIISYYYSFASIVLGHSEREIELDLTSKANRKDWILSKNSVQS